MNTPQLSTTETIEAVIDLIEMGAIAQRDIVKCLRSAINNTPKREWQGLTDEKRSALLDKYYFDDPSDAFMKEFEAKLKEKNA